MPYYYVQVVKKLNVIELSKKILSLYPIEKLLSLNYSDMVKLKGIDSGKACSLLAAIELGKRALKKHSTNLPTIQNPQDIVNMVGDLTKLRKEHLIVLYLNARNQVIEKETVSVGTLNSLIIHPREIFEPAVRYLAAQIVLVHNHPSGNPEPSEEDENMTKRLITAGTLMGIEIIDHIIVTSTTWYSFREEGFFDNI